MQKKKIKKIDIINILETPPYKCIKNTVDLQQSQSLRKK
jgi:hypothetical protein